MDSLALVQSRYSCKAYDANKKIPRETFQRLLEILRLTPSSINIQPWKFLIAQSDEAKNKIIQAMPNATTQQHNITKIQNCSDVIIFAGKNQLSSEHIDLIIETEQEAGRFATEEIRNNRHNMMYSYVQNYKKDLRQYIDQQVYIALGNILLAAQMENVDATAIGGFDNEILDSVLDLPSQNLHSVVILALGYHAENDFNAKLPKARLAHEQVFQYL